MITVKDDDVITTIHYLWSRLKIVVELAGAISLTPLFHRDFPVGGKRIGVIVSGGNVDVRNAGELFGGIRG